MEFAHFGILRNYLKTSKDWNTIAILPVEFTDGHEIVRNQILLDCEDMFVCVERKQNVYL